MHTQTKRPHTMYYTKYQLFHWILNLTYTNHFSKQGLGMVSRVTHGLHHKSYYLVHTWASTQLRGVGEILKIFMGGRIFWKNFWRGIDFLTSKGGISFTTLHQNSRIFLKFSKIFFLGGDIIR